MVKKLRLLITFYKSFAYASIAITLTPLYWAYTRGFVLFMPLLWVKIITSAMIFYLVYSFKKEEFYYYKNLGIAKKYLWIGTFSIDFMIFLILTISAFIIR